MHHFLADGVRLAEVLGVAEFGTRSAGRMWVSLGLLGLLAALAWGTMEGGRPRDLALVLLGFFAFRIVLARASSR